MALYRKWDVKNDSTYVLQFFSLIFDSLGSVWNNDIISFKYIVYKEAYSPGA